MNRAIVSNLRGLAGAILGGLVGFLAFRWIAGQGFYAMILPGALVGLGARTLATLPSPGRGIACGLGALLLSLYAEWAVFPFVADSSLGYFLGHLQELRPITWLMIALGTFFAYHWGREGRGAGLGTATISRPEA